MPQASKLEFSSVCFNVSRRIQREVRKGGRRGGKNWKHVYRYQLFFTKIASKISDEKRYFKAKYSILIRIWLKINLNAAVSVDIKSEKGNNFRKLIAFYVLHLLQLILEIL